MKSYALLATALFWCSSALGAPPAPDLRLVYGSQLAGEIDPCG